MLEKYNLRKNLLLMWRVRGPTYIFDYNFKINYKLWNIGLENFFEGTCFGHAFSKACFSKTCLVCYNGWKMSKGLRYVFIEVAHEIYKNVSLGANKCRQEWNKACVNSNFSPRKVNMLMKIRHLKICIEKNILISFWVFFTKYSLRYCFAFVDLLLFLI
jgi:hypothetical protein